MKKMAIFFIIIVTFTGCSKRSSNITGTYVSPLQYQHYTCAQVGQEIGRVNRKVQEVAGIQDRTAGKDAAAMTVGLVLFWPALFFLIGGDKKGELAGLKGEFSALESIAIEKNCSTVLAAIEKSKEANKEAAKETELSTSYNQNLSYTPPPSTPAQAVQPTPIATNSETSIATATNSETPLVIATSSKTSEWNAKSLQSLQNGQWAEAIRTATIAISLDPSSTVPYINRSWAYAEKGMYHKALADCDHTLSLEPNNSSALHNKGLTYSKMGETEKSLKNYRIACDQGFDLSCSNFKDIVGYTPSDESKILLQWSNEKFSQGKYKEVVNLCGKVIDIEPNNYEAYSTKCAANASLDLLDEAKPDCEKSISLNPDFPMAYNNLGYVLERSGNESEAGLYYEMSCGLGNTLGCKNHKRLNN